VQDASEGREQPRLAHLKACLVGNKALQERYTQRSDAVKTTSMMAFATLAGRG